MAMASVRHGGERWEGDANWYDETTIAMAPSKNPLELDSGLSRGDDCYFSTACLRVAYRSYYTPLGFNINGFRCVSGSD